MTRVDAFSGGLGPFGSFLETEGPIGMDASYMFEARCVSPSKLQAFGTYRKRDLPIFAYTALNFKGPKFVRCEH